MGTRNLEVSRFEVTGVFTHPNALVDIVLVHGLNGEPKHTWTAPNGLYWPAELLPDTLKDTPANILVYGYNADVYSRSHNAGPSDNFIFQHAQTLVAHLTAYRQIEGTTKNPIIWIAHSLGGILLKRALLYSNDLRDTEHEAHRSIYVSTYGIIFLGTPHTGSGLATWGRILQGMSDSVLPRKLFESESILLKTLKRDNERLQEINNHFLDIYQRFRIQMVHENHKTDLKTMKALIVDADSASPQLPGVMYYGIEATHSDMCKFSGPNAPGYRTMTAAIRDWATEAPHIIEVRWTVEKDDRVARVHRELDERRMPFTLAQTHTNTILRTCADMTGGPATPTFSIHSHTPTDIAAPARPSTTGMVDSPTIGSSVFVSDATTSPMPLHPLHPIPSGTSDASTSKPDPIFLHPEKFRPNSYFVGREKELADLHQMLTDKAKRAEGTSAVVIHSLPGGGKTHLARQYVFQHRADYPGGVYWVRAKSIPEIEQFYWKIAKNEALREVVAKTMSQGSSDNSSSQKDLCDPRKIVDIVRIWFNNFDQWLLVFDGITFTTPGIERFIPDAKNTSLIYTSIQSSASGRYVFDNPQIMKLDLPKPEDARDHLLIEMERKRPWTSDDKTRALELVKLMGCLPLMVHIAAQHLKATREPLAKYLKPSRDRVRAGDLSAYRTVWDDLKSRGAHPALNLMYILAYFDNRIPVGFLNLGLGALDNTTPVMTREASQRTKSLNNSLRTLMAFALLERSESDSVSPSSSQGSSTQGRRDNKTPESVDLLRIHTVVQLFFVDVIADERQSDFWLERSASVYCYAFDAAEKLITTTPKVGLLDDYRCFKIHGAKLLEHLVRMEKKSPLSHTLSTVRDRIQNRLRACEQAIMKLSEATQMYIVSEMDYNNPSQEDYSAMSVFERANSTSGSEASISGPNSQNSVNSSAVSSRTGTGFDGERTGVHVINTNAEMLMDIDMPAILDHELGFVDTMDETPTTGKGKDPMTQPWPTDELQPNPANGDAMFQSPGLIYAPTFPGGYNPTHWHVPIDPNQDGIPVPPRLDEDMETNGVQTQVPTPHIPLAPKIETEAHRPDFPLAQSENRTQHLELTGSSHRTVRRNNDRRYHDRAGSWRDKTISDPRISVSREFAKGSVYMSHNESSDRHSSGHGQISAGSEAELSLNRIRAAANRSSPLRSRQGSIAVSDTLDDTGDDTQSKSRAHSSGAVGVRPLLAIRPNVQNYGTSTDQHENESQPINTAARPPKRPSQSPPSRQLNTWKRFKNSVLPTPSSHRAQSRQQRQENGRLSNPGETLSPIDANNAMSNSIESLSGSQPGTMFMGSRTARSTPNEGYSPSEPPPHLQPANRHYTPAPFAFQDGNAQDTGNMATAGGAHHDLPASIRQWETQVYHRGHQRLSSTDIGFGIHDEDPMATSYPQGPQLSYSRHFSMQPPPLPPTQQVQQQLLQPSRYADGYTSQPMSRDASIHSHTYTNDCGRPGRPRSGPVAGGEVANDAEEGRQPDAHSLPQSYEERSAPLSMQPPPRLRRNSRSSLVETEPSPQTANPFPDVNTSYQRWEERHEHGPYMHSWRVTEVRTVQPSLGSSSSSFRPMLGTIGARAVLQNSGSASGSGSGDAAMADRPGSAAISRSHSGSATGSVHGSGSGQDVKGAPAAGSWTGESHNPFGSIPSRTGPPGISPHPSQVPTFDGGGGGGDYLPEPMSRGNSSSGQGRGQTDGSAHQHALQEFGSSHHGGP